MYRPLAAAVVALGALACPLFAQELPERIEIGEGHMTVGFELKTTDRGPGPGGRTGAHSLMRYVIPKPGHTWSAAQQGVVDRWTSLGNAERTTFFFEHYAGGYNATNFVVDTERYPHLDARVSWYGNSLGIPHIEIRSAPFDSPRAAYAAMHELRSTVSETIAFHVHTRFPDTGVAAENADAAADWFRRASWSIWLRRADMSKKTSFVLKQADNQPVSATELEGLRRRLAQVAGGGEVLGRRGLRVQRMRGPNGEPLVDVELRGLMKDLPRMRRLMLATGEAFRTGDFGRWSYADSPFQRERGLDVAALSRTSRWSPTQLDALQASTVDAMERYGVSSRLGPDVVGASVRDLAEADTKAGRRTLLPSAFDWLFLPLEHDPALPEGVQEQVVEQKRAYLQRVVRLAERTHSGEFGAPGGARFRALSVASRVRRILHDFVNERYVDGGRQAKLFEWYETSLFEPAEVAERTQRWRRETGRNRAMERTSGLGPGERAGRGFERSAGPASRGVGVGASGILGSRLDRALDRTREAERGRRGR